MIDLRLGRWQDVLADVQPDAVICDPPYGARTHAGHDAGTRDSGEALNALRYAAWTPGAVSEFVVAWTPRTRRWIVAMSPVIGGKPRGLMGALVRDYSEPGDLICDPCAGGATTLLAARDEGRRAVGAEVDPETCEAARERIGAGWTPRLF